MICNLQYSFTYIPPANKYYANPKYEGFIPHMNSESIYMKGYTPITRVCFASKKHQLIPNLYSLSQSILFRNISTKNFKEDPSLPTISRFHGKETNPPPHPCYNVSVTLGCSFINYFSRIIRQSKIS